MRSSMKKPRNIGIFTQPKSLSASSTDSTSSCLKTFSIPFCEYTVNPASASHFYPILRNRATGETRQSYGEKDPSLDQIGYQFQAAGDQKLVKTLQRKRLNPKSGQTLVGQNQRRRACRGKLPRIHKSCLLKPASYLFERISIPHLCVHQHIDGED
jgi:hypothetical protein